MYDVAPKISEAGKPIFMYNIDDLVGKLLAYMIEKEYFVFQKRFTTYKVSKIHILYLKITKNIHFLRFWVFE